VKKNQQRPFWLEAVVPMNLYRQLAFFEYPAAAIFRVNQPYKSFISVAIKINLSLAFRYILWEVKEMALYSSQQKKKNKQNNYFCFSKQIKEKVEDKHAH
jgi:hypothetical protein